MTINIPIKVQKNSFSVGRFFLSFVFVFFFSFLFREIYILSCFTCNTATCLLCIRGRPTIRYDGIVFSFFERERILFRNKSDTFQS